MKPPELLHNMSSRPRTAVDVRVDPIDRRLTLFTLEGMTTELNGLVGGRTRARQSQTLADFICKGDVTRLAARLEEAWTPLALRGAMLLYSGLSGVLYAAIAPCRDPLVVLNVLARARGNVLMPDAPLVLQPRSLDRCVVTDDPRLTALVPEESHGS